MTCRVVDDLKERSARVGRAEKAKESLIKEVKIYQGNVSESIKKI